MFARPCPTASAGPKLIGNTNHSFIGYANMSPTIYTPPWLIYFKSLDCICWLFVDSKHSISYHLWELVCNLSQVGINGPKMLSRLLSRELQKVAFMHKHNKTLSTVSWDFDNLYRLQQGTQRICLYVWSCI